MNTNYEENGMAKILFDLSDRPYMEWADEDLVVIDAWLLLLAHVPQLLEGSREQ